jgi:DNA-binding transcriptional ArsR family regulator
MKKPILDVYDKEILRALYKYNHEMSTNQIAEILQMSWTTVDTHLRVLDKIYVRRRRCGNRTYWRLR